MSNEQLNAFLAKISSDPDLQERLKAQTDPIEVAAIAREHGLNVSSDSLLQLAHGAPVELNDSELENVTGGSMCTASTNGCEGVTVVFSILTVLDSGC
jgi:predicted ribosomally synthesized peptide with nif11-like leader